MTVAEREDVETRERVIVWDTEEVLYVHPVASLFPMMTSDELDDLAEDIRSNGQADPIVVDGYRQLIDGRNRLEACRRAKASPDIIEIELADSVAYILSKNVTRRHLSKGQAAMVAAAAQNFSEKRSNQGERSAAAAAAGVSAPRLSFAIAVLRHAPDLVGQVLSGAKELNEAYRTAMERKRAAADEEAQMERLRTEAGDLASLVTEGTLSLSEAMAAVKQRQADERAHKVATTRLLLGVLLALDPGAFTPSERAAELLGGLDRTLVAEAASIDVPHLRACASVLDALLSRLAQEVAR